MNGDHATHRFSPNDRAQTPYARDIPITPRIIFLDLCTVARAVDLTDGLRAARRRRRFFDADGVALADALAFPVRAKSKVQIQV